MVIEIADWEYPVFEEITNILKKHSDIYHITPDEEAIMSLPSIEINLNRRKVFCNQHEISLTVKEYDILCLLGKNRRQVLTYEQIYQRVWGVDALGNEKKIVGFHIRNIRSKLSVNYSSNSVEIENVRGVGYRML